MMQRRVSITIDRLVLYGVAIGDSRAYASAIEAALARELAEAPLPPASTSRLDAGAVGDPGDAGAVGGRIGALLAGRPPGTGSGR